MNEAPAENGVMTRSAKVTRRTGKNSGQIIAFWGVLAPNCVSGGDEGRRERCAVNKPISTAGSGNHHADARRGELYVRASRGKARWP